MLSLGREVPSDLPSGDPSASILGKTRDGGESTSDEGFATVSFAVCN